MERHLFDEIGGRDDVMYQERGDLLPRGPGIVGDEPLATGRLGLVTHRRRVQLESRGFPVDQTNYSLLL